jgi:hypothetical protein
MTSSFVIICGHRMKLMLFFISAVNQPMVVARGEGLHEFRAL